MDPTENDGLQMVEWQKGPRKGSSLRAMHTLVISTSMDLSINDTLSYSLIHSHGIPKPERPWSMGNSFDRSCNSLPSLFTEGHMWLGIMENY